MTVRTPLVLFALLAAAALSPTCSVTPGGGDEPGPGERLFELRTAVAVHERPWAVRALDVDEDGDLDVVVGGASIAVLVNDGRGELSVGSSYGDLEEAIDFATGDFDGDRDLELVVAEHDAPEPRFLLFDLIAGGGLTAAPGSPFVVDAVPHLHTIAALDLDRDGHLDVVTDSWPESRLVLVRGRGDGTFDLPGRQLPVPSAPMQNLVAGDLDGDARLDVVTPAHDREGVSVLLGDGAGSLVLAPGAPFPSHGGFTTLALADVEGDGDLDVLAVHRSDASTAYRVDALSVMENDGAGSLVHAPGSPFTDLPERSSELAAGDFDGDGRLDVVVLGESWHELALFVGTEAGLVARGRQRLEGDARGLAAADLDGDGRDELLVTDRAAGRLAILERVN